MLAVSSRLNTPPGVGPSHWYGDSVWLVTLLMLIVAVGLFCYVGWQIHKKRRALQYITIEDRRRFYNIAVVATTILLSALVGMITLMSAASA